jgi:leader peptidase (prepilin peptidase)/N-methyltransferase
VISDHALVVMAFLAGLPASWCVHRMVTRIPQWIATSGLGPEAGSDSGVELTNQGIMPIAAPSSPPSFRWVAWVFLSLGALFACSAVKWGASVTTVTSMLLISMLTTLAWIDLRTGLLPDVLTKSGAAIGLITHAWTGSVPFPSALIGFILGYLSLWVFFQLYRLATHKDGMGYGDFKLFAMLGAWLGWESLAPILLVASLSALAVAIMGMAMRRLTLQSSMPFGPYLVFGGILRLFDWI